MNIGYKVGELIYDANIYDGLNTFLSDLQFYKKWLPKNKEAEILELRSEEHTSELQSR